MFPPSLDVLTYYAQLSCGAVAVGGLLLAAWMRADPNREPRRTVVPDAAIRQAADPPSIDATPLCRRIGELCAANPQLAALVDGGLSWMVDNRQPPKSCRNVIDLHTYALLVGHVLQAGWELRAPQSLIQLLLSQIQHYRMLLVDSRWEVRSEKLDLRRPLHAQLRSVLRMLSRITQDHLTEDPLLPEQDLPRLWDTQWRVVFGALGGTPAGPVDSLLPATPDDPPPLTSRHYCRAVAYLIGNAWSLGIPDVAVGRMLQALSTVPATVVVR